MTRQKVQEKIQEIVETQKDQALVKESIKAWLEGKVTEDEAGRILNDLTSYKEFLEL